jgi:hypothetical protein
VRVDLQQLHEPAPHADLRVVHVCYVLLSLRVLQPAVRDGRDGARGCRVVIRTLLVREMRYVDSMLSALQPADCAADCSLQIEITLHRAPKVLRAQ